MPVELNEEQQAVRDHPLGEHGRVIAGPGTGKSTAAVALARRLLTQERPPRIRFLTFTRAATSELARKMEEGGIVVRPSTIHSFALSVVLQNPGCAAYPHPLPIPNGYEQDNLLWGDLARRCRIHKTRLKYRVIPEMAARWERLDARYVRKDVGPAERARFYGHWGEHRQIFGYTLLAELPSLLREALVAHDDLRGTGHELFLVDEYQDLNACDLEVVRLLAERGAAVLAVGDDDQSIYSFRMAHPAGIRRFPADYGIRHDYTLRACHRLPRRIMGWAQFVISGATDRDPNKAPLMPTEGAPQGTAELLTFGRETTEARGIVRLVRWLTDTRRVPASEILILTRSDHNGTFSRPIRDQLQGMGIPVADPGRVGRLLAESENRKFMAVLRLAANPNDSLAWWTLISLTAGLGDGFVDSLYERARANGTTFAAALRAASAEGFGGGTQGSLAGRLWASTSAALAAVQLGHAEGGRWGERIVRESEAGRLSPCAADLRDLLLKLDDLVEEDVDLTRFLSSMQPLGEDLAREHSEGVRVMTMTGSKGLTVRATIVAGVDNDLVPRRDGDREEERRLLYVAMTRAREYLFLTWASRRQGPTARAAGSTAGRRTYSEFLRGGPVDQVRGDVYILSLPN